MEMTPELIQKAIADDRVEGCYALKGKGAGLPGLREGFGFGCFTTPYSRVAMAAQDARKKYATFSEADVTPEMLEPVLEVVAPPRDRLDGPGVVSVEAVVVMPSKSKDRSAAILPIDGEQIDAYYQNILGATFEGVGLVARFPLSALKKGNEVRIAYDGLACADWKNKRFSECKVPLKLNKSVR